MTVSNSHCQRRGPLLSHWRGKISPKFFRDRVFCDKVCQAPGSATLRHTFRERLPSGSSIFPSCTSAPHILIVDDHREIRDLVSRALDQGGLPGQRRSGRPRHAQGAGRQPHRPHPSRPDAAGRGRPVAVPHPARRVEDPDHHADRQRRRGRSRDRSGDGRRRLPAQAVRQPRARRAHQGRPAAQPRRFLAGKIQRATEAVPLRSLAARCRRARAAPR